MKRFFVLFLAVVVCLSLCVSVAFAQSQYDSFIHAYFPWFGGVTSAGAYLTNTGTVTSSDVTFTSLTGNQMFNATARSNVAGLNVTAGTTFTVTGTATQSQYVRVFSSGLTQTGHKYLFIGSSPDLYFYFNNYVSLDNFIWTSNHAEFEIRLSVNQGQLYNNQYWVNIFDLTAIFGAGAEPSYSDFISILNASSVSVPAPYGSVTLSPVSTFSLVPQSTVMYDVDQYVHEYDDLSFEVDLSSSNDVSLAITSYMLDDYSNYVFWGLDNGVNLTSLFYSSSDFYNTYVSGNTTKVLLDFDETFSHIGGSGLNSIRVQIDASKVPPFFAVNTSTIGSNVFTLFNVSLGSSASYDSNNRLISVSSSFLDSLSDPRLIGTSSSVLSGSVSLDSVSNKEIYHTVIYSNNIVNLGTYDFNINVVFPSLQKFNSFSGYWMGSFNTSWGEIPVRTEIQEVSSNSASLIKIYKVTFDVPFTGQYTKFNIKYVGDSSSFTTIRVDSSVIDPNAYKPTQNQVTSLNGFTGWLNGALDSLWGKFRSLFFDQDQTYQEVAQSTTSSELAADSAEVSEGSSTIHEYETENFDSIEEQMDSLDWEIPSDFGSASNPNSALGFISTFFGGIFLSLGSKVQVLIVIPLMLGLCLLILGRGGQALGAINKLFR